MKNEIFLRAIGQIASCQKQVGWTRLIPSRFQSSASALHTKARIPTPLPIPIPRRSALHKRRHVVTQGTRYASSIPESTSLLDRTGLYDLHLRHGAKMVPFAGYSMPVQYSDLSVGDSHRWTREKASLFDVGHMVQHRISGPDSKALLEKITPTTIAAIQPNCSTLSCLLHPKTGGIVDDCIITLLGRPTTPRTYYLVTNAACRAKDIDYISAQISAYSFNVNWTVLSNQGLIALQGPLSASILQKVLPESEADSITKLHFGNSASLSLIAVDSGVRLPPVLVTRAGYTGEDGFEISIPGEITALVTETILKSAGPDNLRLAGLGARDSLRLEAGMCLYGHDLDDTTTPAEAALGWVVGKQRRATRGFHGAEVILNQLKAKGDGGAGISRRRVGLIVEGAPAREGAEIVGGQGMGGEVVGRVTSGCPSPSLGKNIAMGYVRSGFHALGTELGVVVRGKTREAMVVKMPFVETRYWRG